MVQPCSFHASEALSEGITVLLVLKVVHFDKLVNEDFLHVDGDLFATVAVEDAEEAASVGQVGPGDMSILLRFAPALHASGAPAHLCAVAIL